MKKIQIPIGKAAHPMFISGVRKLAQTRGLNVIDVYRLAQSIPVVNTALQSFDQARLALVKQYGKEIEGGWEVPKEAPNYAEFDTKLTTLLAEPVTLELERKIKLGDATSDLTAQEISELMDLVEV